MDLALMMIAIDAAIFYVVRAILTDIGFYRYVWRPEIMNVALFVLLWCAGMFLASF